MKNNLIIDKSDLILITGANGFIGSKVFEILLKYGFKRIRCFTRSNRNLNSLHQIAKSSKAEVEFIEGNLLSRDDCRRAVKDVSLVLHLAAGTGKSFASCFMDSALATRNLLDVAIEGNFLKRFLNVSSFAVYSGFKMRPGDILDESSPIETNHMDRFDPYAYGKIKQEEIVKEYGRKFGIPFVIVRPGVVYGPGKNSIPGRIGINTFGFFIHLGGSNKIPITYLDNCAEAIVRAGLITGIDGEVFNIVDDDLPTSRQFLTLYKKKIKPFFSIYIPYPFFYLLNLLWEKYSKWSEGQLPPVFNRRNCATYYQKQKYSNLKLKKMTGWFPKVSFKEGFDNYSEFIKELNRS